MIYSERRKSEHQHYIFKLDTTERNRKEYTLQEVEDSYYEPSREHYTDINMEEEKSVAMEDSEVLSFLGNNMAILNISKSRKRFYSTIITLF